MIDPSAPDYAFTPVSDGRPDFGYAALDREAPPHVSIVTPFFNTDRVFLETARSVTGQSLQQWEWLVVNDGTTDTAALALLAACREGDPRIRVIDHETNRGLSAARNTGFGAARAPYVIQLDSDDLLEPTAAEKLLWCLESFPEYAFVTGFSVGFGAREYRSEQGFDRGRDFLEANRANATAIVRRDVHAAVRGYDEANRDGLEDWEFWLRCASHGHWGGTVPEYLDWCRSRASHGDRWRNWTRAGIRHFRSRLRESYPDLWNGEFPDPQPGVRAARACGTDCVPFENRLTKTGRLLLLLADGSEATGGVFADPQLVQPLAEEGWQLTFVSTSPLGSRELARLGRRTADVFALPHFLRPEDQPRFLRYLIASRAIDGVLASGDAGLRLLPYLRAHFPALALIGGLGTEPGDQPLLPVVLDRRRDLDATFVTSQDVAAALVRGGMNQQTVTRCDPADPKALAQTLTTRLAGLAAERRSSQTPSPDTRRAAALAPRIVEQTRRARAARWLHGERARRSRATVTPSLALRLHDTLEQTQHQRDVWRRLAEQRERFLRDAERWMEELEQGSTWLEDQRTNWRRTADERLAQIDELREWIEALESDKRWLEEQRGNWKQIAEERLAQIEELERWVEQLQQQGQHWLSRSRAPAAEKG